MARYSKFLTTCPPRRRGADGGDFWGHLPSLSVGLLVSFLATIVLFPTW